MTKLWWILVLTLLFLCYPAFPQNNQPFRVVALLPLTGALSEYGVAAKNGIELARNEQAQLFRNIEFMYDDSQYDSKTGLSSYHRHTSSGGVSVFYVWGYSICQALAPIAESDKFPIIAASAERSVSSGRRYVLRFNYHHQQIAAALWDHLRSKGFKRIAIVKTELAYMNGVLAGMQALANGDERIEVIETYDISDMDFRTGIVKLRSKSFDALGAFLVGSQGSQFFRQAKQLKFEAAVFGTDFFDSDTVAQEAGGAMNGLVFATQQASPEFRARYVKVYGNDYQAPWAANSYEFALLVAQLFGEHPVPLSHEQVMEKFRTSEAHTAGAAHYSFSDSQEGAGFDFRVALRQVEGNRVVDHEGSR